MEEVGPVLLEHVLDQGLHVHAVGELVDVDAAQQLVDVDPVEEGVDDAERVSGRVGGTEQALDEEAVEHDHQLGDSEQGEHRPTVGFRAVLGGGHDPARAAREWFETGAGRFLTNTAHSSPTAWPRS